MSGVTPGLERWLNGDDDAGLRPGARIGLLAHPASIDRQARHAVDRIRDSGSYRLVRLFAPEHGLWGREQDMEPVSETEDPRTGLSVVSLYGADEASLRPTARSLRDLDAIVIDLQDVGSRYYTFIYTVSHVMGAAGDAGLPVVVLDRPNPVGGDIVEGPVLDPALRSFVGLHPLPVRHGMTVGELARMFRDEFDVDCDLRVVPASGWNRSQSFDRTGLPWVPPSPNMPTPATATVYPGGCLVEGTNLSEGRGTTTPFQQVGAPWLDGPALARSLRESDGFVVRSASFRPMFHKHAGSTCEGVQVIVTDPRAFRPFTAYLALLSAARLQDPASFRWRTEPYEFDSDRLAIDLLFGHPRLRDMFEAGASVAEMERSWRDGLDRFVEDRRRFLLYP